MEKLIDGSKASVSSWRWIITDEWKENIDRRSLTFKEKLRKLNKKLTQIRHFYY